MQEFFDLCRKSLQFKSKQLQFFNDKNDIVIFEIDEIDQKHERRNECENFVIENSHERISTIDFDDDVFSNFFVL